MRVEPETTPLERKNENSFLSRAPADTKFATKGGWKVCVVQGCIKYRSFDPKDLEMLTSDIDSNARPEYHLVKIS